STRPAGTSLTRACSRGWHGLCRYDGHCRHPAPKSGGRTPCCQDTRRVEHHRLVDLCHGPVHTRVKQLVAGRQGARGAPRRAAHAGRARDGERRLKENLDQEKAMAKRVQAIAKKLGKAAKSSNGKRG